VAETEEQMYNFAPKPAIALNRALCAVFILCISQTVLQIS
jgi:hypothetical protein